MRCKFELVFLDLTVSAQYLDEDRSFAPETRALPQRHASWPQDYERNIHLRFQWHGLNECLRSVYRYLSHRNDKTKPSILDALNKGLVSSLLSFLSNPLREFSTFVFRTTFELTKKR